MRGTGWVLAVIDIAHVAEAGFHGNGQGFGIGGIGLRPRYALADLTFDLIQHITKTRAFTAGTILGSGTVSNQDEARGVSCLAERRMREILKDGKPTTQFLEDGDRVRIEMRDADGKNLFGTIDQKVARA